MCGSDIGPGTQAIYCGNPLNDAPYDHENSSTFVDVHREWRESFSDHHPYFGEFALDTIGFEDDERGETVLFVNMSFVRILLGDTRLLLISLRI
jgi:hypothetical protein